MSFLGEYIFRVTCCAIVCNIILSIQSSSTAKNIVRFISGVMLTFAIISPFREISVADLDCMQHQYFRDGAEVADRGEDYLKNSCRKIITDELEAYILDKGEMLGCSIDVNIGLNEEGCPDYVVLSGTVTPELRKKLENILTKDLGITEEDCRWNTTGILFP